MTTIDRVVKFCELMSDVIHPLEVKHLSERLYEAGFFDAPASTKYHGNYPGGLFDHSYAVTLALLGITENMGLEWGREASPYLVGMLHDLCKCHQYIAKEGGGYEYNKDLYLTGHGDRSVILANLYGVHLTEEEVLCIRWHMGAFDEKENWNAYGKAIEKYPNVLWTHTADMVASKIEGV